MRYQNDSVHIRTDIIVALFYKYVNFYQPRACNFPQKENHPYVEGWDPYLRLAS